MVMAAFIGLLTGLGAAGFETMIDGVDAIVFDWLLDDVLGSLGDWKLILAPTLGGLLVGGFTYLLARDVRGAGVAPVLAAVETNAGRMNPWTVLPKPIASALTVGSGGSAGKEGPVVQIGAAIGSTIARTLHLSEETVKLMLASGAAGGIAATFNAPIAGVFFALEVILRRFNTRNFSVVVLASVVATITAVFLRGPDPTVSIQPHELVNALVELPLYAVLGAIAGGISVVFMRSLYWTEDRFAEAPIHPLLLPAAGGFLVGAVGLIDRDVFGLGDQALDAALSGESAIRALLLLLLLKVVATSLTIGSGGSGGVFGPALFIGAMLGAAFGGVVNEVLPDQTASSGAYATVGMAALTAGTARSPITAVLIIFELTQDYETILPVMTAVVTATLVSQLLSSDTIYTYRLSRRGVVIEEEQLPVNVMQSLRVSDAMSPVGVRVTPDAPIGDIAMELAGDHDTIALVVGDAGELGGVITDTDVTQALGEDGGESLTADDVCSTDLQTIFPDQSLHDALGVFAGRSMHALPVMLRDQPRIPCGILRRTDITNAYAGAIETRDAQTRRGRLRRVLSDDVRYLELRVERGSVLNGHRLSELDMPRTRSWSPCGTTGRRSSRAVTPD